MKTDSCAEYLPRLRPLCDPTVLDFMLKSHAYAETPTRPYAEIPSSWWRGKDSNLRRQSRQIYSLIPLTAREPLQIKRKIMKRLFKAVNGKALPMQGGFVLSGINTETR